MYICICNAITDRDLASLLQSGDCDDQELVEQLGLRAEGACGQCADNFECLLDTANILLDRPVRVLR